MNLLTKQKETHREEIYICQGGRRGGRESEGVWDGCVHTAAFKMDSQQGPAV